MPKQPKPVDLASLFKEAGSKLSISAREPNALMYQPHEKQRLFHESCAFGRLYMGGNRSGKTFSAVMEDIWWATGTHPYRETPPTPIRGRCVAVDFQDGVERILVPLFKQLCTPSMLINGKWEDSYNKNEHLLTFENGSTIEFMSYEQQTEKFAGTSRHFIHYDEEPPKHIFDECQMRIIDTNGSFWISMTPVEGMTWVHDILFMPVKDAFDAEVIRESGPNYGAVTYSKCLEMLAVEVDMDENPYLDPVGKDRAMRLLSDDEKKSRKAGNFVEIGGLVYKAFDPKVHVIPTFVPPKSWDWYMSVDHGWNNPTAILWHAVSPAGDVYTFSEHFASEMTIEQHATVVHMRESMWGKEPEARVGDPAMKQTNGVTGTSIITEYANRGIYINVEGIPRQVEIGVAKIQQYLRINPGTNKPKWFICENCPNLIRELRRLRWKKYASKKMQFDNNKPEQIHKKDDHCADSARYFFTCLPDLGDDNPTEQGPYVEPATVDTNYGLALLRSINEGRPDPDAEQSWDIHEGVDLADLSL